MGPILFFTKKLHAFAGSVLYLNLLGMVIISFLNGVGIVLLIPLLSISGIIDMNTQTIALLDMFEFLKQMPRSSGLLMVLAFYILLIVGQALLQRNVGLRDVRIHTDYMNHIRLETYRSLMHANWDFFIKKRKSDFIHALTDELGRVTGGTFMFLQLMTSLVFTVIQVGMAFWLSPQMTIFVLVCGCVLALFSRTFIHKSKQLGGQTSNLAKRYMGAITDHFNGMKDIKSNRLEQHQIDWMQNWCQELKEERDGHARLSANSQLYYKISSSLIIVLFIYISVLLFHTKGEQLLIIILIFSRLWPRFTGIQSNMEQIAAAVPAFQALIELQRECMEAKEIKESPHDEPLMKKKKKLRIERLMECRQVYFRYNRKEQHYALRNISLEIPSNRMTAIVGRSGAGKSTLIDLLMGLMQPDKGQIWIDGNPLASDILLSLRRSVGYVPQDPFLFNGTIKENMRMMEPNASEEQIWEALEQAAAADFVRILPQGLETVLGDRGIRLSGGERQRLVLARALLRKPSILILDEATSALDTENEAKIQHVLDELKGTMTIIVIAHRLSTIANADQVIVLDQGAIVQQGEFNQLAGEPEGLFVKFLGNQQTGKLALTCSL